MKNLNYWLVKSLSVQVRWLRRKIAGLALITAQIILQFVDGRYSYIREWLRSRHKWRFSIRTLDEYMIICTWKLILLLIDIFKNFRKLCHELRSRSRALLYIAFHIGGNAKIYAHKIWVTQPTSIWLCLSSTIYAAVSANVQANTRRLITSRYIRMTHRNRRHTWCTTMLTIYTGGWYVNHCHTLNFDGSKTLWTLMRAITPDSPHGYIFEVDLEYPQYLHD